MCDTDAGDHRWIAEDYRCLLKPVKEGDPRAQQHRSEVDVNLVEKAGVEPLSNCLASVDAYRAVSRGRRGLCHGAFQAFGYEMDGRVRPGPTTRNAEVDDERLY